MNFTGPGDERPVDEMRIRKKKRGRDCTDQGNPAREGGKRVVLQPGQKGRKENSEWAEGGLSTRTRPKYIIHKEGRGHRHPQVRGYRKGKTSAQRKVQNSSPAGPKTGVTSGKTSASREGDRDPTEKKRLDFTGRPLLKVDFHKGRCCCVGGNRPSIKRKPLSARARTVHFAIKEGGDTCFE